MKRIIAFLLLAVMCLAMFAGCGEPEVDTTLTDAETLLKSLYDKNYNKATIDFDVVKQVKVGDAVVTVTWAVDNSAIKIKESSKAGYYTVDLPAKNDKEITYTLTATLTDANGNTLEVKFANRKLPAFDTSLVVSAPVENTAYKIYLVNAKAGGGTTVFALAATEKNEGKFVSTTKDPTKAADFYVTKVEGGYHVYTKVDGKNMYLNASTTKGEDDKVSKFLGFGETAESVWYRKDDVNAWFTKVSGEEYVIGTYSNYTTISISEASYITKENSGKDQFPANFVTPENAASTIVEAAKPTEVTLAKFLEIANALEDKASTTERYQITGKIVEIASEKYGNMYIQDEDGNKVYIYGVYDKNGEVRYDALETQPKVGDTITLVGIAKKYGSAQMENGCIYALVPGEGGEQGGNDNDDKITVDTSAPVTPVAGTAYKFYLTNTSNNKSYFLSGGMQATYYLATNTDPNEALDVYVEAAGEGTFYLYCMDNGSKLYINLVKSGTHNNAVYGETAVTAYTYDTTLQTLVSDLEGTTIALGTSGTYTTFGGVDVSKSGLYLGHFGVAVPDDGQGGNTDPAPSTEPAVNAPVAEIIDFAYSLTDNAVSSTVYTLTGTVTEITETYTEQYKNVSFVISIEGVTKTMLCFRAKGEGADTLKVGDTVTVSGNFKNYGGTIEMYPATIDSVVAGTGGGNTDPAPSNEPATDAPVADIIDFAYSLATGTSSINVYTLTGKVTEITEAYTDQYKNVSFVISIEGVTKTMLCFRAKGDGAATLKVGDTATVSGNFKNYNGTIEMTPATLVSVVPGNGEEGGDEGGDATPPAGTTLDFTAQGYANEEAVASVTGTNFTVTFDAGTNTYGPKYYNSGAAIRVYGSNSMTITAESGYTIKSITLTFGSSDKTNEITVDAGTFDGTTWTGEASAVVFTVGGTSGHRRIASVTVELEANA